MARASTVPFTEDVTYWNPSWTITHGAIQTTNIDDMHTSAVAIGTGRLLKPATFQQMITKDLIGKTTAVKGFLTCFPSSPHTPTASASSQPETGLRGPGAACLTPWLELPRLRRTRSG